MYYGLDENGNLISSESSDILSDEYQELFPENIHDIPGFELEDDFISSVPDNDLNYPSEFFPSYVTYDDLIQILALQPSYNVFPNTSAISVFDGVFRSSAYNQNYIILSGSDTSYTYMFYSPNYEINGNNIILKSPVTQCIYYNIRSGTTTNYYYSVSEVGDTSFNINNNLVYTNILEGYPSLPSDDRHIGHISSSSEITTIGILGIFIVSILIFIKKGSKK